MSDPQALNGAADPNPKMVKAGHYVVDPVHTRVLFSISHFGFSTFYGEFPGAWGHLDIDPASPERAALKVSVPVANVTTTNSTLDWELRSADWLDAQRYPAITFESASVDVTGQGEALVHGALTLHGVTRPLTLKVRFVGGGINPVKDLYTIGFDARGRIKRSQFGVESHLPLIGDDLELILSGAFEIQSQA